MSFFISFTEKEKDPYRKTLSLSNICFYNFSDNPGNNLMGHLESSSFLSPFPPQINVEVTVCARVCNLLLSNIEYGGEGFFRSCPIIYFPDCLNLKFEYSTTAR